MKILRKQSVRMWSGMPYLQTNLNSNSTIPSNSLFLMHFWWHISKGMLHKCVSPTPFNRFFSIQSTTVLPMVTFWPGHLTPNLVAQLLRCSFPQFLTSIHHTTSSPRLYKFQAVQFIVPYFLAAAQSTKNIPQLYSHCIGMGSHLYKFNRLTLTFPNNNCPFNFAS